MGRMIRLIVLMLISGCGKPAPEVYTVRGLVIVPPSLQGGGRVMTVLHESIPDFKGADGDSLNMPAMSMRVGLGPQVPAGEIRRGSRIEMTFNVDWHREPRLMVVSLQVLPEDVELDLGGHIVELPEEA